MEKILFKNITFILGISILFIGCDSGSDHNITIKIRESKIPSFSDTSKEKIGCKQEKNNNEACLKENSLSSEDMILESLMKNDVKTIATESKNTAQALTRLVEESEPKKRKNVAQSLELLVASASNFADVDEKSIGTFDIEKFSTTWQELQSLVDNSEETQTRQKSLIEELEVLVVTAATSATADENIEKVEAKVKALLKISSNTSSIQETKFSNAIMSDMSDKTIDLIEANDQWIKIKIQSGETLSSYAKKYYGDPNKYRIIYEANRDVIGTDYMIYVGSILKIPTLNSIQGI